MSSRLLWTIVCAGLALGAQASPPHAVDELLGTWRGTSTCTDRTAAPACKDETVVYEFRRSGTPGHVTLAADKIVNDQRVPMGELDVAWDAAEACWRADFGSPRPTVRWCFTTDGATLTGTGRLLPGNEIVRSVALQRVAGR